MKEDRPMARSTTVSCPGKVLIAGGYLVLEPENGGLVVATASRFYTVVRDAPEPAAGPSSGPTTSSRDIRIKVNSPQFVEATWIYTVRVEHSNSFALSQVQDGAPKNGFVQEALEAALKVSTAMGKPPTRDLLVDIVGDNDFYSQARTVQTQTPSTAHIMKEPPAFAHLNTSLGKVHKTGLGSSAAMVTSFVTGILLHLSESTQEKLDDNTLRLYHNVAQYSHSRAQGKVGSGFDVSSAIFGSQVYYRFSTDCLQRLLDHQDPSPANLLLGLSPSSPLWQAGSPTAGRVEEFSLPPLMTMLLADVDAGSNTPSMVKSVLKWRANDADSDILWQKIGNANKQLADIFGQLRQESLINREEYVDCIKTFAASKSAEWEPNSSPTQRLLCQARDTAQLIRQSMKAMGLASDVPIEPDEQTRLLDYCIGKCDGVLAGGVPGAGGYDAIWLLVLDPTALGDVTSDSGESPAESKIHKIWSDWTEMSVKALSSKARISEPFSSVSGPIHEKPFSGLRSHILQEVTRLEDVLQNATAGF